MLARRLIAALLLVGLPCLKTMADPSSFPLIGSIKGADGGWDYASVDGQHHRLYVARGDGVMAVDLDSGVVTDRLVAGKRLHGVIALPDDLAIFSDGESSSAVLFQAADGAVVARFPAGRKPDAVVRDPRSGRVAVMNGDDGTVTVIDVAARAVTGTIQVDGKLEFAVADDHGHVFVNIEDRNEMAELDLAARTVTRRFPLESCDSPTGLAIDPATSLLLVACGNGKAVALSAKTGRILASLPIGDRPDAVMFDGHRHRFLVPCGGNGVLSVISEAADGALAVIATVTTARGARTGAVESASGRIYLPVADFAPAKADERPVALPGSFHILVFGQN